MPYNYYNSQYMPNGYVPYYQNNQRQDMYAQYNRQQTLLGKVVEGIDVVKRN